MNEAHWLIYASFNYVRQWLVTFWCQVINSAHACETIILSILMNIYIYIYRKTSNIRRTLVGNEIVDHLDVVGASPVGAASNYIFILDLTSGFKGFGKDNHKTIRESFKCWDLVRLMLETWRYIYIYLCVYIEVEHFWRWNITPYWCIMV